MSPVEPGTGDDVWDLVDQRLVAALRCDPRVSAERAGAVLGLAPRRVARRWSALLADGSVRLSTSPAPGPGALTSLWRLAPDPAAGPGAPAALLAALADRGDVHDAELTASGDEVVAAHVSAPGSAPGRAPDGAPREEAGLRGPVGPRAPGTSRVPAPRAPGGPGQLPGGLRGVVAARAVVVLHRYADAHQRRSDVLTAAERTALTPDRSGPPGPPGSPGTSAQDEEDARVLAVLRRDPRASAVAVAAATGWPASTARRRLAVLLGSGRLRTRVHLDAARLGLGARAHLHLQLPPGRVDAVAGALVGHEAVHELLAVTGTSPLRALVAARDVEHLHLLLTRDLPQLAGGELTGVETVMLAP